MSLFPTAPTASYLVEFNAGKCIVEGSWIKPDTRKGKLYMDQGDDQLLHLYWKERKNNSTPEDDMIIFSDEAEFKRVEECTTGRVYILKFKTSNETHFYWMQNKNEEKDNELVERVNELIRDPEAGMNISSELDESASHDELMRLLNDAESQDPNLTPENLLQFLNSMNENIGSQDEPEANTPPAPRTVTAAPAPPTSTPAAAAVPAADVTPVTETPASNTNQPEQSNEQLDQLRQILANIRPNEGATPISLSDVLTSQSLTPLLNDPEICASLFPFLPEESERSVEEVRQVVRSPQFSQALQSLSAALATGQLGPLLSQLGLDPSAGNSVESFLIAIGEQAKQKKNKNDDAMEED
ncbi:proteasome complex subunit Rpn13 ubiquitin receptor-domain-containing protein [Pilaira anomala]|nr:proteasome complex subunit Rpn13 ubiquitin receptor-domain-containing protein [Pilaira anomala]